MSTQTLLWVGFHIFVLAMLALDLGVFHRKAHVVRVREALVWSVVWIALALAFNVGVYLWKGSETALQFLTGVKLAFQKGSGVHPERNPVVCLFKKFMPVTTDYREDPFFVRETGAGGPRRSSLFS